MIGVSPRADLVAARFTAILACLGVATAAHADPIDRMVEDLRADLQAQLDTTHWNAEEAGLDDLIEQAEQRLRDGQSPPRVLSWASTELPTRWLSFAPIRSAPRLAFKYRVPFDPLVHWLIAQGVGPGGSHEGWNQFALDFWMPEGTPVLAAREGTVARVVDGFTRCCLSKEEAHAANTVYVLHADGTFASYVHLRPGAVVKVGQAVKAGDLLGYSGSTGWSHYPHLHFEVDVRDSGPGIRSIPVKFENGTPTGYLPAPVGYYVNRPRLPVRLNVSIDGSEVASVEPFLLKGREPVSLRVQVVGADGVLTDVTHSPHTRYVVVTPWSVRIDAERRVHFGSTSETWAAVPEPIRKDLAIVAVLHRDPARGDGAFDVLFRFPDTAPPD